MSSLVVNILIALHLISASLALPATWSSANATSLSNGDTSLTILYQNNLNASDDSNHISAILLDKLTVSQAAAACGKLSEQLLSRSAIEAHYDDFYYQLSYVAYDGRASRDQQYTISGGVVAFDGQRACLDFQATPYGDVSLPVLCTQSSNQSQPTTAVAIPANEITVAAGGNTYIGYRNLKSWRFSGIPYADQPQRWHYSGLYSKRGQILNATAFGSECPQNGAGSENCLFVNIQTPYIPKAGSKKKLKPVMFWIHGMSDVQ